MGSYQVIARKYRPQRFSDVVGQDHVTQTLTNAIRANRIAHAYLFVGPRGTGKTTIARIFAKCLNCTDGPKAEFPEEDPKAREIAEGRSLDVLEIDGASNRGIEEIRELRETVKYAPASSKYKIFIIDEVHMLTKEAFNALLKTLEEPPEHVKFMFATTEAEKVLPTILSRCQRFDLRRISSALIVKHLAYIAGLENVSIDDAALHAIARGADGGMRDAESTLDQLISFCGEKIVEDDVLSMFGLTARSQLLDLAQGILTGAIPQVLRDLNELSKNGKDLSRLLGDLLGYFRNLVVYTVSKGDLSLLEVSEAEAGALKAHTEITTTSAVTRIMEILSDAEGRMREAISKKIMLEVAMLRAAQARNSVNLDTVLDRLKTLRDSTPASALVAEPPRAPAKAIVVPESAAPPKPVAPAVAERPAAAPLTLQDTPPWQTPAAPVATPAPVQPISMAGDINSVWPQVMQLLKQKNSFTRSLFNDAFPVSLDAKFLVIGFDSSMPDHLSVVDNSKNKQALEASLKEIGHAQVSVKFILTKAPAGWVPPAEAALEFSASKPSVSVPSSPVAAAEPKKEKVVPVILNKEDFQNDPLIKKALELFKGEIIEVRA